MLVLDRINERIRRMFIALLLIAVVVQVAMLAGLWQHQLVLDPARFIPVNGLAYKHKMDPPLSWLSRGDRVGAERSGLQLFEDGQPLGPSHSLESAIVTRGQGRYLHWDTVLLLSASDNSNPASNQRVYSVVYALKLPPLLLLVTLLVLLVFMGFGPHMKRALPSLVLVLVSVAVAVLPVELFLRSDYSKQHVLGVYGSLPAALAPTLNGLGYRDVTHQTDAREGVFRVLVLGDSFTYGSGLGDDDLYTRKLQQLAGPDVEVISLAHNGWQTGDHLDALTRDGLQYRPDVVIIGAVSNDPGPPTYEHNGQQDDWAVFQRIPLLDLDLFRYLDYQINRLAGVWGQRYSYSQWEADLYDPNKRYWPVWLETVKELAATLDRHGIPGYAFILVSPVGPDNPKQIAKYQKLTRVFNDAGLHAVNLWQPFMDRFGDAKGKELWALPNDPHPNGEINTLYAEQIWQVIKPLVAQHPQPSSSGPEM